MGEFFELSEKELSGAYIEEGFIAEVQYTISVMLKEKGVSRSEFARRLGVSPAAVSQMLGDEGANLTSRTIAKAFIALGEEPAICTKRRLKIDNEKHYQSDSSIQAEDGWFGLPLSPQPDWQHEVVEPTKSSNDDKRWDNVVWLQAKAA